MRDWCVQGMSIGTIAELRHLKLDTVESYLAEAMVAGKAYDWHRLHVSDGVLSTVTEHAATQLAAAEPASIAGSSAGAFQSYGPPTQKQHCMAHVSGVCSEAPASEGFGNEENEDHSRTTGRPQQSSSLGSGAVHGSTAAHASIHADSSAAAGRACPDRSAPAAFPAAGKTASGYQGGLYNGKAHSVPAVASSRQSSARWQQGQQGPVVFGQSEAVAGARPYSRALRAEQAGTDLLCRLQARGCTIKTLKEQLPDSIRYGQIRLCLAHAGRLGSC